MSFILVLKSLISGSESFELVTYRPTLGARLKTFPFLYNALKHFLNPSRLNSTSETGKCRGNDSDLACWFEFLNFTNMFGKLFDAPKKIAIRIGSANSLANFKNSN